jgi:hypothetical protein
LASSSAFALTLWDALDRGQEAALREEVAELETLLADGGGLAPRVRGPSLAIGSENELYRELAAIWERSSVQMDALCAAYGIRYIHALQPNQYWPDSKPLTEEEREVAYYDDSSTAERIPRGYRLLREAGERLRERGVHFVDLTGIFAAERRTVYTDPCCHVNELGARLIAERLAAAILADEPPEHSAPDPNA